MWRRMRPSRSRVSAHRHSAATSQRITAQLPIEEEAAPDDVPLLATLKPLGQIRESFILAVNHDGLWIIDQHVAHERVLFEKVLRQRAAEKVESQRLLMPLDHRAHTQSPGGFRRDLRRAAAERL